MRSVTVLLCLLVLGACGDRRDFDQRYNDAGAELEKRARSLDQNLANELPAEGNMSE